MRRSAAVLMMMTGLGALGGCGSDSATGAGGGSGTTATSTGTGTVESCDKAALQASKDLALKVSLEVFLKNASADGILSKDFVAHFPAGQPDQTLDGFLGFGATFRAAFPDGAFAFTHVIAAGDLVALRYIGTGTQKGDIFGVPATNKAVRWEGMVVRRMAGGLVVEEWNAPDNASLIGQLAMGAATPSPDAKSHQGAGDCTPSVVDADTQVALGVSKNVVLKGVAPETLMTADFVMHNPNGSPDLDLAGFVGFNVGLRAAFPDASFVFTHSFSEGGLVALRYTATGTHSADFFGVPATGKKVAWEGMVIRRIAAGKAAEEWNAPDIAGLLGQLTAK
jgi:predicted ester cyclase